MDDAREGAVEARMRHALADGAVGRDAIAVGADQRHRRGDDVLDVVLGDRGDQHAGRALVVGEIVAQRVDRVLAALGGERREWCGRRTAAGAARSRSARSPTTGCGPSCSGRRARCRRGFSSRVSGASAARASPARRRPAPIAAAGSSADWSPRHRDRRRNRRRGRAPWRRRSSSSAVAALPQLSVPEHLKCTISTWTPQCLGDVDRLLHGLEHLVRIHRADG